jgi:hypothetical protein
MHSAALLLLLLSKPPCTKAVQGQMWPNVANQDKTALELLARSGTLEVCMSSNWRYKWQHVSIQSKSQILKNP